MATKLPSEPISIQSIIPLAYTCGQVLTDPSYTILKNPILHEDLTGIDGDDQFNA